METIATYQQLALLIEAILKQYFINKEMKGFTSNHEQLHRNFYRLKKDFPQYFERLTFDTNGHYPYSEDLDSILQDFQICGIINKLNPKFRTIIFNEVENFDERKAKRIPFVEDNVLQDIAAKLTI
ncbi:MAG: hypothetical protein MUO72_18650 [Bacteroidales bacterium]|nr:hypothetical protein [Bacteroidales bacterium]